MKLRNFPIKYTAAALAASVFLSLFCSCESGNGENPDGPGSGVDMIGAVPTGIDLGGAEFTVLSFTEKAGVNELTADPASENFVDRAISERNAEAEKALGVKITVREAEEKRAGEQPYSEYLKECILAGSGKVDAIAGSRDILNDAALADLLTAVNELPYIKSDLSAACFYPGATDELTVNGRLYYLIGDLTLSCFDSSDALFFNKQTAKEDKLDDLYQLVRDNEWTIDKLMEITRGTYRDFNGNSRRDQGDFFGYLTDCYKTADSLCPHFDLCETAKGENAAVEIAIDQGKAVSVLEKMIGFFGTGDVCAFGAYGQPSADDRSTAEIFSSGRALFYQDALGTAASMRNSGASFGILPFPKWDSRQDGYYTAPHNGYTVIVVPKDAPDRERSGAVLDAMFTLSAKIVLPAYGDSVLGTGRSRDDESGEMLEIIRSGIRINFGSFHRIGMDHLMRDLIASGNENFVTFFAVSARSCSSELNSLLSVMYGKK